AERVAVRAAERLRDHVVDQTELLQAVGRYAHRLGGRLGLLRGLPQDRRAALRRDHGIDAVLQHHHLVRDTDRERAAGAALADHDADDWRPEARHREKIARDRLALTALLRADAGIRTLGIDQRDEGQREFLRELH